jgi:CHASE3 domain sensor protein
MTDEDLHERINKLVDQERELRSHASHTPDQRAELDRLEVALDQAWDLLRQRQALRDAGQDPAAAEPRPGSEVEGYLQ